MFKNLKQKTLNSSQDTSLISSRSFSSSSLNEEADNSTLSPSHLYQSVDSLTNITEDHSTSQRAVFGNLEGIIDDLKSEINKKDAENKRLQKSIKDLDQKILHLEDGCKKEEEGRLAIERAYEKLEDSSEVKIKQLEEKLEEEKVSACNQLQHQIDRLKKDNEKLSKKKTSADAVAWENKAESLEKAYQELVEIQEHSEIQMQKMKDLIKLKDDELQGLQRRFDETEERYQVIQQANATKAQASVKDKVEDGAEKETGDIETVSKEDFDALNWQVASYQQEIETLEKHVVKLEVDLEDVQQKSSDKEFRIYRLREDIRNKDLVIDTMKCDSLELANAVDRTRALLSDTRTELEATKTSYTTTISELQEQIDLLTEKFDQSEQECKRQTDLVEQLTIAASATKTMKSNLQEDLESWKLKLTESQTVCENYAAAEVRFEQKIESMELQLEKQDSLNDQIASLKEELAASQQNEEELKQENEYLTVARESWNDERADLEEDFRKQMEQQIEKNRALREEVDLFRKSSQATILPVSSSLQAKFVKGVTEVDITTRKGLEEELADLRERCRGLEGELSSKAKQLKQNQQHLADMKKTLQSELRAAQGNNVSPSTSRTSPSQSRKLDILLPLDNTLPIPYKHSDVSYLEPINLEYLKHCVIKFMCCLSDNETAYLLKVISVLLNFSDEETIIVQEALKCRSSWFRQTPKSLKRLNSTRESK